MFCKNCGTQNAEGVAFCANCGNALQESISEPMTKPSKKSPAKWIILAVALVVVVVIIILAVLFGGDGKLSESGVSEKDEEVSEEDEELEMVDKYFEAFKDADAEKMMNYVLPKDIQEGYFEAMEDAIDMDQEDFLDEMNDRLEELWDETVVFEWEIKETENLDKLDKLEDEVEDYSSSRFGIEIKDIDDFRDYMDAIYGDYGFDADKIKDAYVVEVKIKAEYDGEKESSKEIEIIYKYEGKWYLLSGFALF